MRPFQHGWFESGPLVEAIQGSRLLSSDRRGRMSAPNGGGLPGALGGMRGGGVQAQLIGLVDSKELHARLIQVRKLGSKLSAHLRK